MSDDDMLPISFEARGFRDVYWCPIDNEPIIIRYEKDRPICPECKCHLDIESKSADTVHPFMFHIEKPRRGVDL